MNMLDFVSSEEEQQREDNSTHGAISTTDHSTRKSKLIRKKYEPIRDGDNYVRYEDNPTEYKYLRKKIQNRESAARIRGRKKGTIQSLEIEVEDLKNENSELLLKNASLETENNSLKNQIGFLRGLIQNQSVPRNPQNNSEIDQYLNLSPPKTNNSTNNYQSPFEEEDSAMQWVRDSYSSGSRSNWSTIFMMTMIICVFVLPSDTSSSDSIVAFQTSHKESIKTVNYMQVAIIYGKTLAKYLIICVYAFFTGSFVYSRYQKSKMKKM